MNKKPVMPVLFVGHGTPMNAIEDNEFSRGWRDMAGTLQKPSAILCVSAHWETDGTQATAMKEPRTIHDFGGFPQALYEARYPAPGAPDLARLIKKSVKKADVKLDEEWGLDHGCWSVLSRMYPKADVPTVQLSLDVNLSPGDQYELAKELAPLRREGVLILGSGNMVHNLGLVQIPSGDFSDFNKPFGFDWAIKANDLFKKLINENRHQELIDYHQLGKEVGLAIPTNEHYLPLLYALALKEEGDSLAYFNDKPVGGSVTMTSLVISRKP